MRRRVQCLVLCLRFAHGLELSSRILDKSRHDSSWNILHGGSTLLVCILFELSCFSCRSPQLFQGSFGIVSVARDILNLTFYLHLEKTGQYSNHLNTKHLNTGFSTGVRYSNGKVTWLNGPFEYRTFWTIIRFFSLVFRPPFDNRTKIYHSNTRLVRYSDGNCTRRILIIVTSKTVGIWIQDLSSFQTVEINLVWKCSKFEWCSSCPKQLNSDLKFRHL